MTPPRIAVSGVLRTWQDARRAGVNAAYLQSVVQAGGVPVIVSQLLGPALAPRSLAGCEGLLLTGGEDVDPACYGAAAEATLRTVDRARDEFELALFRAARARRLPVLGICRGLQVINVALGGTLWQDLASQRPGPVKHDGSTAGSVRTHTVAVAPGSRAARALGGAALEVNSFHHQGVRELAPGLEATGWADDGLIEAVECEDGEGWILAVQWHPEEMHVEPSAPDRGLFVALVAAACR